MTTLNWFKDITCTHGSVISVTSEQEIADVLRDHDRYPSPVRPMGSRHSMTPCMSAAIPGKAANFGTAIDLTTLTGAIVLDEVAMTASIPAGRKFIEIAQELRSRGFQIPMVTEFGSLTMGAAACAATKQSSFDGMPGQMGSYVVGLRLVCPNGSIVDLKDHDLVAARCSYGLFGVASNVTFRVKPSTDLSIEYKEMHIDEFEQCSKAWTGDNLAVKVFLFPYTHDGGRIVAELRREVTADGHEKSGLLWLRNWFWRFGAPRVALFADHLRGPFGWGSDAWQYLLRKFLVMFLKLERVSPVDTIVDFRKEVSPFTFSMWAFPTPNFPSILREYFKFCRAYRDQNQYRTDLPHISYRIARDQNALLSYSHDSDVWTIDPVCTGKEAGWPRFLQAFNEKCSSWGGSPLLNQTPALTPEQIQTAFGTRLDQFKSIRAQFDPENRMLNDYFARLLA